MLLLLLCVCLFVHLRGCLGPEEYSEMRVVYTPKQRGTFSCQNFVLSTPGGNRVVLNVSGQAVGPVVTFSSRCVHGCARVELLLDKSTSHHVEVLHWARQWALWVLR